MSTQSANILQLSLFETSDNRKANYTALFDLAPRYMLKADRKNGSAFLDGVIREFTFNGERYRLSISPARIRDFKTGAERDELPGEREQLVEDVIRKMASDRLHLGNQDEVLTTFTVYAICQELQRHKHTFNNTEVKEALQILHRSVIEITKVVEAGEKKPKPVVSASVFPTLAFKDENDYATQAYVQLNPFLAQAIKSLAFEQVDYEWMMQIRGHMARWVFKSISLMLTENDEDTEFLEIKASDIALNYGSQWSRWRDMLAHVNKAIEHLVSVNMISDFTVKDVKKGNKKEDAIYVLRFSKKFIEDRRLAKTKREFVGKTAVEKVGHKTPKHWKPISAGEALSIKIGISNSAKKSALLN